MQRGGVTETREAHVPLLQKDENTNIQVAISEGGGTVGSSGNSEITGKRHNFLAWRISSRKEVGLTCISERGSLRQIDESLAKCGGESKGCCERKIESTQSAGNQRGHGVKNTRGHIGKIGDEGDISSREGKNCNQNCMKGTDRGKKYNRKKRAGAHGDSSTRKALQVPREKGMRKDGNGNRAKSGNLVMNEGGCT